jgi:methyl-accepting chemotaxis protein
MANEDIEMTFDENPFVQAIENLTESMEDLNFTIDSMADNIGDTLDEFSSAFDNMDKGAEKTQDNMKGTAKSVQKVGLSFQNLLGIASKVFIVFQIFKSLIAEIPEIMTVFKIAGDIIQRNLLFPLRTKLIPLLQKVLDWVKNNRTFFVKLGEVIANTFTAAIGIGKAFLKVVKSITESFFKGLGVKTESFFTRITEKINLLLFKAVGISQLIAATIGPVLSSLSEFLGTLTKFVIEAGKSFFEGLFGDFDIITNVIKSFEDLSKILTKITSSDKTIKYFKAIGAAVRLMAEGIMNTVDGMVQLLSVISGIKKPGEALEDWMEKIGSGVTGKLGEKIGTSLEGLAGFFIKPQVQLVSPEERAKRRKVNDAIIKGNQIIEPHPDDVIIATKNPVNVNNKPEMGTARNIVNNNTNSNTTNANKQTSINVGDININVDMPSNTSSPTEIGNSIASSVEKTLYNVLFRQMEAQGVR